MASNPFSHHLQNPEGVASNPLSPTHTHIITQFTSEGPRRLDISHRNVRNYKALKAVKKSLYHLQSKIKVSTPCEFMLMWLNLKKTLGVYQTCPLCPLCPPLPTAPDSSLLVWKMFVWLIILALFIRKTFVSLEPVRLVLVCIRMLSGMYPYAICMLVVCVCMYSYAPYANLMLLVYYPYVTLCYS